MVGVELGFKGVGLVYLSSRVDVGIGFVLEEKGIYEIKFYEINRIKINKIKS